MSEEPFKGNIDLRKLETLLSDPLKSKVACVIMTITNNAGGGQPVSLSHLRDVQRVCDSHQVPMWLNAARFAENAYLVSLREPGQEARAPRQIAEDTFRLADGTWMSLKKDGLCNIDGVIALRDAELAQRCRELLIATEGFSTYGGLAGPDLEALAQGPRLHERA